MSSVKRPAKDQMIQLLEAVPVPMVFTRAEDGEILACNFLYGDMIGAAEEALVGRYSTEFYQNPTERQELVEKIRGKQWVTRRELNLKKADGAFFQAAISMRPYPFEGSEEMLVGFYDITHHKRTEQGLRESEERMRMLLADAPVILYSLDPQGIFLMSEGRDLQKLNRKPGEVVGMSAFEVFKDLPDRIAHLRRGLAGETFTAEVRVNDQWYQAHHQPIFDAGNILTELIVVSTNITDRMKAEAKLKASEVRLAQAVDIAKLGTWSLDLDTYMLDWSAKTCEIFGFRPESTRGPYSVYLEHLDPPDRTLVDEAMHRSIHENTSYRLEHKILHRSGQERLLQVQGEVFHDDKGLPDCVFGIISDITERVQVEKQLRLGQKMQAVGQLAGGAAHEFNNLLQIIRGYSELALSNVHRIELVTRYTAKVISAAQNASQLTHQLLTFSRQGVLQKENIDLNRLIAQKHDILRHMAGETIEVRTEFRQRKAMVFADENLMEQVIFNLCINAKDAMGKGGTLTIATDVKPAEQIALRTQEGEVPDTIVVLTVSDTGSGMTPDVVERIFEPFFSTKNVGKGTGLGLSTVYSIIQDHQGQVELQSEPGQGTRFSIYLPESRGVEAPREDMETAQGAAGSGTILFAEDEGEVRALLAQALESCGYHVLQVADGEEAMRMFNDRNSGIDLVLLDAVMPKKGGREVYEEIRDQNPQIPVLFSTGHSSDLLDKKYLESPHTHLIQKPYGLEDLCRRIKGILASSTPDAS